MKTPDGVPGHPLDRGALRLHQRRVDRRAVPAAAVAEAVDPRAVRGRQRGAAALPVGAARASRRRTARPSSPPRSALYFLIGDGEPVAAGGVRARRPMTRPTSCSARAPRSCASCRRRSSSPSRRGTTTRSSSPSIPGAKLKRVAAAAGTNDGQNIQRRHLRRAARVDRARRARASGTVLTNGTGARRQPMVLQITTAGFDQDTICCRQYAHGRTVARGPGRRPALPLSLGRGAGRRGLPRSGRMGARSTRLTA